LIDLNFIDKVAEFLRRNEVKMQTNQIPKLKEKRKQYCIDLAVNMERTNNEIT